MLAFIPLTTFMQQLEDLFFLCLQKEKFHTALAVKKLQLKIMNHQQKENKKNTPLQREDDSSQTEDDPPPSSSHIHSLPNTPLNEIQNAEVTSPSPATSTSTSTSIMALPSPQPTTPSATSASTSPTVNIQAHKTPAHQHNTRHKHNHHHNRPLQHILSKPPSPNHSRIDILTSKLLSSSTQNLCEILKRKKE